MGKLLRAAVAWLLKHPEVVEAVADAVTSHQKKHV
jgi:hypothetical protein